jgi:ribosome-associated toxin RatA of RatAB toxin-antitoxin module
MAFEHSVVVDAPAAVLFALTQDYRRRLEWDPFLKSAELLGGATEAAVGVRAWCVAWSGMGMETEYVSYNPPRTCAVKMTKGPRFLHSFAGTWHFEETAPGRTSVTFRYHLRAKPAWLAWMLTPVMARVFARDMRRRLKALKHAVESPQAAASPVGTGLKN